VVCNSAEHEFRETCLGVCTTDWLPVYSISSFSSLFVRSDWIGVLWIEIDCEIVSIPSQPCYLCYMLNVMLYVLFWRLSLSVTHLSHSLFWDRIMFFFSLFISQFPFAGKEQSMRRSKSKAVTLIHSLLELLYKLLLNENDPKRPISRITRLVWILPIVLAFV